MSECLMYNSIHMEYEKCKANKRQRHLSGVSSWGDSVQHLSYLPFQSSPREAVVMVAKATKLIFFSPTGIRRAVLRTDAWVRGS